MALAVLGVNDRPHGVIGGFQPPRLLEDLPRVTDRPSPRTQHIQTTF